jgi:Flp pilus assembly protein TadB
MSLAILAMVLTTIGTSGAVRQEDEGTQAHIFQIWLVLEVVLVAVFAVEWVPRRPKQALVVLANPVCGFQLVTRSANRREPRPARWHR